MKEEKEQTKVEEEAEKEDLGVEEQEQELILNLSMHQNLQELPLLSR